MISMANIKTASNQLKRNPVDDGSNTEPQVMHLNNLLDVDDKHGNMVKIHQ
ncbi:hypothetical protein L208DRAFT_542718 [Tricholoma matsutake]|nr:hypothetical protein L208DRAFT_542718 [Tricholoma matsutake 945]